MSNNQALSARYLEVRTPVDSWLVSIAVILALYGLVMVFSATLSGDPREGGRYLFFYKHLAFLCVGVAISIAVALTRIEWWRQGASTLLFIGMALLVLVLLPGIGAEINGSMRWIRLGPVNLQPSELAKVFFVIYLSAFLARSRDAEDANFSRGVLFTGFMYVVFSILLLAEPDFGTLVVLTGTTVGMLFLAGLKLRYFIAGLAATVPAFLLLAVVAPYRMARLTSFLDPWSDPYGSGYQLVHALIAFGRGELAGVGLGESVQKLMYLPHAYNDFILAVIGEELGFIGVAAVIVLFGLLLWRIFHLARRAEEGGHVFAARLSQGIGLLLLLQAMVNIGVNLGVLPTKGLTLPFMSYGGSALLSNALALGLLLMVEREIRPRPGKAL